MIKNILAFVLFCCVTVYGNDLDNVDFDTDNFNMVCINPLVSEKGSKGKVHKAIQKGYLRQVQGLVLKVQKINSINVKQYFPQKKKGKKRVYRIKEDKEASKEFIELLKVVNDYYEAHDKEKVVAKPKPKPKAKDTANSDDPFGDDAIDEELDFSESEITELTKKGDKVEDKYKSSLEAAMNQINIVYHNSNLDKDTPWLIPYEFIGSIEKLSPNVVFGEYFNPTKRGRRYFLSINIFIFIIDSDGDARVMVQEISDYNWKRNHRFITAQSGKVIQDTIAKMTGTDIK